MTRNRASVNGGYVRKTVSLPANLVDRIQVILDADPELTMSAFMTRAGELYTSREEKKKKRTR
jgi:hypothetical protein